MPGVKLFSFTNCNSYTCWCSRYASFVVGYITATLATYFVGNEAESKDSEVASESTIKELSIQINELKLDIRKLSKLKFYNKKI